MSDSYSTGMCEKCGMVFVTMPLCGCHENEFAELNNRIAELEAENAQLTTLTKSLDTAWKCSNIRIEEAEERAKKLENILIFVFANTGMADGVASLLSPEYKEIINDLRKPTEQEDV